MAPVRADSTDGDPVDGALTLSPGEQVLAVHPSTDSLVDALPPSAFENLLVVSANHDLSVLERAVTVHGGDPAETWVVPVGTETPGETTLRTTVRITPSDLTGLSIRVSQHLDDLRPDEGWLVLDSLGLLLMYAARERVARFLHWLATALRSRSAHGVFGVSAGTTTDETRRLLRQALDREVTLG